MKRPLHRIRLFLKHRFDSIRNERMKLTVLQAIPFWVASVITGLIAVVYAKLFYGLKCYRIAL